MLAHYQNGEAREIGIVYSQFRSAISQSPTYERLLPISGPEGKEGQTKGEDAKAGLGATEYLVEPSRAQLIPLIIQELRRSRRFFTRCWKLSASILRPANDRHGTRQ